MNHESDSECTCDVGMGPECPSCRDFNYRQLMRSQPRPPEKKCSTGPHVVDLMLHYEQLRKDSRK